MLVMRSRNIVNDVKIIILSYSKLLGLRIGEMGEFLLFGLNYLVFIWFLLVDVVVCGLLFFVM